MNWNWELPSWPNFYYDSSKVADLEKQFLMEIGSSFAYLKGLSERDYSHYIVDILSIEGVESSRIEGEVLDRESVQSSIKHHFGLEPNVRKKNDKEAGMAKALFNVYATFDAPLTHDMLCQWHGMLMENVPYIDDLGKYRTHSEPMQIVSNRHGDPTVFFQAPSSSRVQKEMDAFIGWFNRSAYSISILERAAIAHIRFESIHPFEDGNGRIGRILIEKILSQGVGRPALISVSAILEKRKKEYYSQLGRCNKSLNAESWLEFFSKVVIEAQKASMELLCFLISKTKLLNRLEGQINSRQEKALLRLFAEGPGGFKGGLSAENYISITKASRATTTRDLADLVIKGALIKTGELKGTRYQLNLEC